MRKLETRKKSIGQAQLTPDVARMLEGRTTIKYIQQEQKSTVSNYRVKTSATDTVQGYLMDKLTVSGGLTATECLSSDNVSKHIDISWPLGLASMLVSGGVLTNNGTDAAWTDVITFGGGNANIKPLAQITSTSTLTANAPEIDLKVGGVSQLGITSNSIDVKKNLYYTGGGTVATQRPLMIYPNNQVVPYSYPNFYRIDSWDSTSYVVAGRNTLTNSIQIYANKGALIQAENAINLDSNTGTYTLADVPAGSGVPLVLSTATGQLYVLNNTYGTIRRKQLQLTRTQLLYLYQYPVELLPAQTGVLYMPLRFAIKQGSTHSYSGNIYCAFGTAYDANGIISDFPLDGNNATTVAAFRNCNAHPPYPYISVREGLPIYLTTNIAITDSSTSSPINVWLEYTELNCAMI